MQSSSAPSTKFKSSSPTKGFPGARKRVRGSLTPSSVSGRKQLKVADPSADAENIVNASAFNSGQHEQCGKAVATARSKAAGLAAPSPPGSNTDAAAPLPGAVDQASAAKASQTPSEQHDDVPHEKGPTETGAAAATDVAGGAPSVHAEADEDKFEYLSESDGCAEAEDDDADDEAGYDPNEAAGLKPAELREMLYTSPVPVTDVVADKGDGARGEIFRGDLSAPGLDLGPVSDDCPVRICELMPLPPLMRISSCHYDP